MTDPKVGASKNGHYQNSIGARKGAQTLRRGHSIGSAVIGHNKLLCDKNTDGKAAGRKRLGDSVCIGITTAKSDNWLVRDDAPGEFMSYPPTKLAVKYLTSPGSTDHKVAGFVNALAIWVSLRRPEGHAAVRTDPYFGMRRRGIAEAVYIAV